MVYGGYGGVYGYMEYTHSSMEISGFARVVSVARWLSFTGEIIHKGPYTGGLGSWLGLGWGCQSYK